ncbi:MAG: metal-dependent hydrolase [Pseudomonadaceae bacterium]|nr:metal-dependent hydrolase [Pseudomonadaceae bacterium]
MTKLQYLGHSAFKVTSGKVVLLVDPFLSGSPTAKTTWQEAAKGVTHIALSHGHSDHVGDTLAVAEASGCTVVGMVELMGHLRAEMPELKTEEANLGGTVDLGGGVAVTLVPAFHSTGTGEDGLAYAGMPAGLVIHTPSSVIYHAGDTCLFGDMALIDELYQPDVGLLPIGGRYTMDAQAAALACEHFFEFQTVVPMHYGTFPALARDAKAFEKACEAKKIPVLTMAVGEEIELDA